MVRDDGRWRNRSLRSAHESDPKFQNFRPSASIARSRVLHHWVLQVSVGGPPGPRSLKFKNSRSIRFCDADLWAASEGHPSNDKPRARVAWTHQITKKVAGNPWESITHCCHCDQCILGDGNSRPTQEKALWQQSQHERSGLGIGTALSYVSCKLSHHPIL